MKDYCQPGLQLEDCVQCGIQMKCCEGPYGIPTGTLSGGHVVPAVILPLHRPLLHALTQENGVQDVGLRSSLTHLFFMDDLKVYARCQAELEHSLLKVDEVSRAVGMEWGLRKCAVVYVVNRRWDESADFLLPKDHEVRALSIGNSYKYLGVEQVLKTDSSKVKQRLAMTYIKRLHMIWNSKLNAKQKVQVTNTWGIFLYTHFFGCLKWTPVELQSWTT